MIRLLPILLLVSIWAGALAQQTLGIFLNDSLATNGYTLFSNSKKTYLVDNCGELVKTWTSNFSTNTAIYLLENGNLLRTARVGGAFSGGGIGGRIEMFNWDGDLVWSYEYASPLYHQHHDIEPLPNGNILILAWERRTKQEALDMGRDSLAISDDGIWPERIVEVEMVGSNQINVVWEWHVWDHLVQDRDSAKSNFGVVAEHPELIDINTPTGIGGTQSANPDWIHANAVAYNPLLDQIALCSRHFQEVWIIDHSTTSQEAAGHTGGDRGKGGDLLYRWGRPANYDRGSQDDQRLWGPHNIQWILEESHPHFGKLLIYNNGPGRPDGNYSSLDIWEASMDAQGAYIIDDSLAFGPTEVEWSYFDGIFFSANTSGVHALPNGNLFACVGTKGFFFEVTLEGKVAWEYVNPVSAVNGPLPQGTPATQNAMFRATRYPADYPAFAGKDLTPMGPIELNPLPNDCTIFNGAVSTENTRQLQGVWLQNNPVSHELRVVNETGTGVVVEIFDLMGRDVAHIKSAGNLITLPAHDWGSGLYLLRISDEKRAAFFSLQFVKY